MQRHHLNAVLIGVGLAFPCVKRGTVKKRLQWRDLLILGLKQACGRHQFLQVFDPGLTALALFRAVIVEEAAHFNHMLGQLIERERL